MWLISGSMLVCSLLQLLTPPTAPARVAEANPAAAGPVPFVRIDGADGAGGLRGDPCAGALYSNIEYDGKNGLTSEDAGSIDWIVSWTADDVVFDEQVELTSFYWITFDSDDLEPVGVDWAIWYAQEDCDGPAKLHEPVAQEDGAVLVERVLLGDFQRSDLWLNRIDLPVATRLVSGTYFVGIRLEIDDYVRSYWMTAPLSGCGAFLQSEIFGYPEFVNWELLIGAETDAALCVLGRVHEPCAGVTCGDSDGSGAVDFGDIDCFVAGLIGPDDWVGCGTQQPGGAYVCANDTNGDQAVNFDDIDGFVFAVINGECP